VRDRIATWLWDRGGALAIAVLALYVAVAPDHIVDGDNAEFASLSTTGGAAHPSGYPAFVLFLRAMRWLPVASGAHQANVATAIVGAAAVLVLHAAARAWGARPIAASLACAVFASGPVVLRVHTEAEVFARLQHPNIVQIYEIGEHDGRPYLSLEYVEGGTLDRALKQVLQTRSTSG